MTLARLVSQTGRVGRLGGARRRRAAAAVDDNRGRHASDGGPAAIADHSNSIHVALADDSNGTQI